MGRCSAHSSPKSLIGKIKFGLTTLSCVVGTVEFFFFVFFGGSGSSDSSESFETQKEFLIWAGFCAKRKSIWIQMGSEHLKVRKEWWGLYQCCVMCARRVYCCSTQKGPGWSTLYAACLYTKNMIYQQMILYIFGRMLFQFSNLRRVVRNDSALLHQYIIILIFLNAQIEIKF